MGNFYVYSFEIIIKNKKRLTKKQVNKIADYIENVFDNSFYEPEFIRDCKIELDWNDAQ
jgi:hypothetical protein